MCCLKGTLSPPRREECLRRNHECSIYTTMPARLFLLVK